MKYTLTIESDYQSDINITLRAKTYYDFILEFEEYLRRLYKSDQQKSICEIREDFYQLLSDSGIRTDEDII